MRYPPDKWTAFYLSLAVPGVGQLWAGSVSCLAWFLVTGVLASFWIGMTQEGGHALLYAGQFASFIALGAFSAEHAKRLMEPAARTRGLLVRERVCQTRRRGRSIEIRLELEYPLAKEELWRHVANVERFLTIDPFHERVVLMRDKPAAGVDLVLWHNAFGRRFARFGRILSWREGVGYTFSDLSARGPKHGFPHVFCVSVGVPALAGPREDRLKPELQLDAAAERHRGRTVRNAISNDQPGNFSRLSITVRGKWTSPLVPVSIGRWWIWLVCREHARLLRKGL